MNFDFGRSGDNVRTRGFEWISPYKNTDIPLPERKTASSAGYDIAAIENVSLPPQQMTLIPTGLKAYMQPDEYLGIHIRSSLAVKQNLSLANSQGIIDADYYNNPDNEGHILVAVFNHGSQKFDIVKGTRIAQGIFYKYLLTDADQVAVSLRKGGFGSTGN